MTIPNPPDLPTEGSYLYDEEFFALQHEPLLLATFLAVRRSILQGNDRPSSKQLAKLLNKSPRAVIHLLQGLEDKRVIVREGGRQQGRAWRYVINPATAWRVPGQDRGAG